METYKFEITIEVGEDNHGDTEYQPTQFEIKDFLNDVLSYNHPHDARRYFHDAKIVAKKTKTLTRNQIIKKIGNPHLKLYTGKDYFYFVFGGYNYAQHSVMVPYLKDLSLDQWVDEGKSFLQEIGQ